MAAVRNASVDAERMGAVGARREATMANRERANAVLMVRVVDVERSNAKDIGLLREYRGPRWAIRQ